MTNEAQSLVQAAFLRLLFYARDRGIDGYISTLHEQREDPKGGFVLTVVSALSALAVEAGEAVEEADAQVDHDESPDAKMDEAEAPNSYGNCTIM